MRTRKRRQVRDYEDESGADIARDGEVVRVPMHLVDHGGRRRVSDALADHFKYAGHRPGYAEHALAFQPMTHDALRDAHEARQNAFDDLCRRSERAWMSDAQKKRLEQLGAEGGDGDEEKNDPEGIPENGDDLARAQADRERAYQEAVERSANAWKISPARANTVEVQRRRWTNEA
jgi:hypothetical protein